MWCCAGVSYHASTVAAACQTLLDIARRDLNLAQRLGFDDLGCLAIEEPRWRLRCVGKLNSRCRLFGNLEAVCDRHRNDLIGEEDLIRPQRRDRLGHVALLEHGLAGLDLFAHVLVREHLADTMDGAGGCVVNGLDPSGGDRSGSQHSMEDGAAGELHRIYLLLCAEQRSALGAHHRPLVRSVECGPGDLAYTLHAPVRCADASIGRDDVHRR